VLLRESGGIRDEKKEYGNGRRSTVIYIHYESHDAAPFLSSKLAASFLPLTS
jgi:hypothetical protein